MNIDDLVDQIAPDVPGAVRATIRNAVMMTARDLCTEAGVWVDVVSAYVPKGRTEAEMDAPDETAEILRIDRVDGLTRSQYSQPAPNMLMLGGSAEKSRQFAVTVVCRPVIGAKTLPSQLTRWAEALIYGALYRVLKMPGQAWTNLQLAAEYRLQYLAHEADAKRLSTTGHQNGPRAVKMRPFV